MKALQRKLWRDLGQLLGQAAAIGLVIMAGVMVLLIMTSNYLALKNSTSDFYQTNAFAEVFTEVRRAPAALLPRIAEISGVSQVESRVQTQARIELPEYSDAIVAHIQSLPDGEPLLLNQVTLLSGRFPERHEQRHIVISEPFATAHELSPGDQVSAILNGRQEELEITGIGLSPEYIYQIGPGDLLPDFARFGVFWMNRQGLAQAIDLTGAFNQLSLTLQRDARPEPVIAALDTMLARYGSRGAYGRDEQASHQFTQEEIEQLRRMAVVLPVIFLGVAAFLLNVMLARIVRSQRQQIAVLKAFGYSFWHICQHFLALTFIITLAGTLVGVVLGTLTAGPVAALLEEYFRFPEFAFSIPLSSILAGALLALLAALSGSLYAVLQAARESPAQAMQPPQPPNFHAGLLDKPWLRQRFSQPTRIMLRNLLRHRSRSLLSITGIALSGGLLMVGAYMYVAFDQLLDIQYRQLQRMDLHLQFTEPVAVRELSTLNAVTGMQYLEGYREVPVRLTAGRHQYRTSLLGLDSDSQLRRLTPAGQAQPQLNAAGVILADALAAELGVVPGDHVTAEVLTEKQGRYQLPILDTIDQPLGLGAYMSRPGLNRLLREGPVISGAWALHDRQTSEQLLTELQEMPHIASIGQITDAEQQIRGYIDDTVLATMSVLLLLAGSITFAVVYNNARITLAERQRELASLRVLGYHRAETSLILVSELLLLVLLAIPLAWLVGTGFTWALATAIATDLYRIPMVTDKFLFGFAATGVLTAALLSIALILRRLWQLDMISALKTE